MLSTLMSNDRQNPSHLLSPSLSMRWSKGFDDDRGFGFVGLADGSPDAFIHASVLATAGQKSIAPGMHLRVRVADGERGRQVTEILSVEARDEPAEAHGTVKWFRSDKGFGFIKLA